MSALNEAQHALDPTGWRNSLNGEVHRSWAYQAMTGHSGDVLNPTGTAEVYMPGARDHEPAGASPA